MNKIPDLSPLAELTGLIDVNVCNVGTSDLTPLFSLTCQEALVFDESDVTGAGKSAERSVAGL